MLLRLFKSNRPLGIVVLPLIIFLAWLPGFSDVQVTQFPYDRLVLPFYKPFAIFCTGEVIFSKIIALLLFFLISILVVRLNIAYFFIPERTQMPAVIYLVIISGSTMLQRCSPVLIASLILMFVIYRIFASYKYIGVAYHYFDTALMISFSSFFYFNSVFFILFVWIGIIMFRSPNWREWVFTIAGFILPYIFLFAIYYYFDKDIAGLLETFRNSIITENPAKEKVAEISVFLIVLAILFIVTSLFMLKKYDTRKIHSRKFFLYFFWIFILTVLIYLIIPSFGLEALIIIVIPLSYLISHFFVFAKLNFLTRMLFSLFILSVFYSVYQSEIFALFR